MAQAIFQVSMCDFVFLLYFEALVGKNQNVLGHCLEGFTYQLYFLIGCMQFLNQLLKASQFILEQEFRVSYNHHKKCVIKEFHGQLKHFQKKYTCCRKFNILCRFLLYYF